jgi:hypothetical protein
MMTYFLRRLGELMAKFLAERLPAVAILAVLPWIERSASESSGRRFGLLPLHADESTSRRSEITEKLF